MRWREGEEGRELKRRGDIHRGPEGDGKLEVLEESVLELHNVLELHLGENTQHVAVVDGQVLPDLGGEEEGGDGDSAPVGGMSRGVSELRDTR